MQTVNDRSGDDKSHNDINAILTNYYLLPIRITFKIALRDPHARKKTFIRKMIRGVEKKNRAEVKFRFIQVRRIKIYLKMEKMDMQFIIVSIAQLLLYLLLPAERMTVGASD